jgi:X-linked retinitis pigmentosa GTPase regulator
LFCFQTGCGEVYVWGCGTEGQLGLGPEIERQIMPKLLQFDDKVVQIACGYYHTMFVTGNVFYSRAIIFSRHTVCA